MRRHCDVPAVALVCAILLCSNAIAIRSCDAKLFTTCGLLAELRRLGVSNSFVGNWICLVRSESFLNTSTVSDKGYGKLALGLFQVSNDQFCKYKKPGGDCRMRCEDLLDEDIADDFQCANKIHAEHGWQWWAGWMRNCRNQPRATVMPIC